MGTITIAGTYGQTLNIEGPNTTVNIARNAALLGNPAGILVNASALNVTININGFVSGPGGALQAAGAGARIHIGVAGELQSQIGVALAGDDSRIVNDGTINANNGYGIYDPGGFGNQLRNNGDINSAIGIVGTGDGGRIINGAQGEILASSQALAASAASGDAYTIINHGRVLAAEGTLVLLCGAENDTVRNDGAMLGLIGLGDGKDTFDTRGGKISNTVIGNDGDDTLIVDKAFYTLTEAAGQGTDTVRSSASYTLSANVEKLFLLGKADINGTGTTLADVLHGNAGDNRLKGQAGLDHLYGHGGNDRLTGGADVDYFHFSKGDDHDTVLDFELGTDWIDVHNWTGMDALGDIQAHAHNQGNDVIITQGGDSLLIKGHHKADLAAMDFVF